MAIQFDEYGGAERRLCGKHLGNSPQLRAIDYAIQSCGKTGPFSVSYSETKSTGLTLLLKGSYAHASGTRPSNLDEYRGSQPLTECRNML